MPTPFLAPPPLPFWQRGDVGKVLDPSQKKGLVDVNEDRFLCDELTIKKNWKTTKLDRSEKELR